MRFLLDTHILLWWLADSPKLSRVAKETIAHPEHFIFISAASIWEMSIKKSLGKLECPDNLLKILQKLEFQILSVSPDHGLRVADLPFHHQDPFDRMLIAQALVEGLTLISQDVKFQHYEVSLLEI